MATDAAFAKRNRTRILYRGSRARCGILGAVVGSALAVGSSVGLVACRKHTAPTSAGAAARTGVTISTPAARAAYVTNNGSDSIAVLDRDGDTVTIAPLDIDPDAHEAPHHLAVDANAGTLFVALGFPPDLAASTGASSGGRGATHGSHGRADSPGSIAKLDLAHLGVVATAEVDQNPGDVLLSRDGKRLFVSHFDMQRAMRVAAAGGSAAAMFATVQIWDTATLTKVAERALCVAPHGMTTTEDGKSLLVACYGSDEIAIVDLTSPGMATSHLALGTDSGVLGAPRYGPYAVALTADDAHAVVADLEGEDLRVFDLHARSFERAIPLGARAMMPALLPDGTALVPLQAPDGIARVDVATGVVTKRVPLDRSTCGAPHVVRIARDGRVYVVCEGDHIAPGAVIAIDPTTLAVTKRWTVGVYPDGIDFGG